MLGKCLLNRRFAVDPWLKSSSSPPLRYPTHIRPKSKQAKQYVRMAIDIARDLELDQPPSSCLSSDDEDGGDGTGDPIDASLVSEERLAGMRGLLGSYYLASSCVPSFEVTCLPKADYHMF